MDRRYLELPVAAIVPSPLNPRRHHDKDALDELTASVKEKGVLEPLLVRPLKMGMQKGTFVSTHELICGERRWTAAKAAGLASVPCIVREDLNDQQVLEIQVIENLQRADVHPLDEALGYRRLHKEHHLAVEDIAARVGKSKAYVYGRMKLADLPKGAQKLFYDGALSPSVALLVARIPVAELAEKAAAEVAHGPRYSPGPVSYRDASEHITRNYMLDLAHAPFDTKETYLSCKDAGPCTTCSKRTGNQPDLFPDVKKGDLCTDPVCHGGKVKAAWEAESAKAEASGVRILDKEESIRVSHHQTDKYEPLDRQVYDAPAKKNGYPTWKQLLGRDLPVVLAQDPQTGAPVKLVDKAEARRLCKERGMAWAQGKKAATNDYASKQQKEQDKNREACRIAARSAQETVIQCGLSLPGWKALLVQLTEHSWHDVVCDLAKELGLKPTAEAVKSGRASAEKQLAIHIDAFQSLRDCEALFARLIVRRSCGWQLDEDLLDALELDAKAITKAAKAKVEAKGKTPAPAKRGGAQK